MFASPAITLFWDVAAGHRRLDHVVKFVWYLVETGLVGKTNRRLSLYEALRLDWIV